MKNTTLKTATAAAARRLFEKRLDAASYRTWKDGGCWFAQAPHGDLFQYMLENAESGAVLCCSSSGMVYRLEHKDGEYYCGCPAAAKAENPGACKHNTGLSACLMNARMAREIGGAK